MDSRPQSRVISRTHSLDSLILSYENNEDDQQQQLVQSQSQENQNNNHQRNTTTAAAAAEAGGKQSPFPHHHAEGRTLSCNPPSVVGATPPPQPSATTRSSSSNATVSPNPQQQHQQDCSQPQVYPRNHPHEQAAMSSTLREYLQQHSSPGSAALPAVPLTPPLHSTSRTRGSSGSSASASGRAGLGSAHQNPLHYQQHRSASNPVSGLPSPFAGSPLARSECGSPTHHHHPLFTTNSTAVSGSLFRNVPTVSGDPSSLQNSPWQHGLSPSTEIIGANFPVDRGTTQPCIGSGGGGTLKMTNRFATTTANSNSNRHRSSSFGETPLTSGVEPSLPPAYPGTSPAAAAVELEEVHIVSSPQTCGGGNPFSVSTPVQSQPSGGLGLSFVPHNNNTAPQQHQQMNSSSIHRVPQLPSAVGGCLLAYPSPSHDCGDGGGEGRSRAVSGSSTSSMVPRVYSRQFSLNSNNSGVGGCGGGDGVASASGSTSYTAYGDPSLLMGMDVMMDDSTCMTDVAPLSRSESRTVSPALYGSYAALGAGPSFGSQSVGANSSPPYQSSIANNSSLVGSGGTASSSPSWSHQPQIPQHSSSSGGGSSPNAQGIRSSNVSFGLPPSVQPVPLFVTGNTRSSSAGSIESES